MIRQFRSGHTARILALGLPIMGGMLSQSILNLVDIWLVGSLGGVALAGVGIGGYANFLAVALVMGFSSGVQALVARRRGEGQADQLALPLNSALLIGLMAGSALTVVFWFAAPLIIRILSPDPAVQAIATPYYQVRILAIMAVAMNFSFRGFWNGMNRSGVYLRTLIVFQCLNVVLSYGLIFGRFGLPELGATGAAWGTTIALYTGSLLYLLQTLPGRIKNGFLQAQPSLESVTSVLRLSVPNSLQQFAFALGISVLFWIIGRVGTHEVAVANVLINLALFLILPAVGLGMAATTLIGEALGQGNFAEAHAWGWRTVRVASLILAVFSLPLWLVPEWTLGHFLHEPEFIALGALPLRLMGMGIVLDTTAIVLTQALLGAGANRKVLKINLIMQWGLFLPCAWLLGPVLGGGLLAIWIAQLVQRAGNSVLFGLIWQKKEWTRIII